MVIHSKEFRLIYDIWLTFSGYSNKVNRNLKGISDAFNVNTDGSIKSYRDYCELVSLPIPMMPYNFKNVLHNPNNPPRSNNGVMFAFQAPAAAAANASSAAANAAAGVAAGAAAAPLAAANG